MRSFSENLNLYRDNEREYYKLVGINEDSGNHSKKKVMKMCETIDLLVTCFGNSFGRTKAQLVGASKVSVLAQSKFEAKYAGSSQLFQDKGAYSELKKYVQEKMKVKGGVLSAHLKEIPEVPDADDDAESGSDADSNSDGSCNSDEDDSVPLGQAFKIRQQKWISQHRPHKNESLDTYQERVKKVMTAGVKGTGWIFDPSLDKTTTLQMAASLHDAMNDHGTAAEPKISKILDSKKTGSGMQYYVRFVRKQGKSSAALPDSWVPECKLRPADKLLAAFKKQQALDTGDQFEVEYIYGKKMGDSGQILYHVKWKGYAKSSNYWEPAANLVGAENAISDFNNKKPTSKRKKKPQSDSSAEDDY